jgi:hypothetical protein
MLVSAVAVTVTSCPQATVTFCRLNFKIFDCELRQLGFSEQAAEIGGEAGTQLTGLRHQHVSECDCSPLGFAS